MSKTAAVVLAFLCLTLISTVSQAQILPRGNVYLGASYADAQDITTRYPFKGWNASAEDLPFARFPKLGFVLDGSGFYRSGLTEYNLLFGPRLSINYGKWRPFVHGMGGVHRQPINGIIHYPVAYDIGGGVDYKLFFKNFSWRLQGDYVHSRLLSAEQKDFRASTGLVWRF
ncbi:MAG TPA: hypothetical protein VMU61_17125 [Candidatus Aquilonibacter sp.]|nr:hypothetical protein [Candidatus Aquilonibacter sp.]